MSERSSFFGTVESGRRALANFMANASVGCASFLKKQGEQHAVSVNLPLQFQEGSSGHNSNLSSVSGNSTIAEAGGAASLARGGDA